MEFFNSAIDVLQTLVTAIGAGLAVWGAINLLEGYGNDNPGAKSQGIKQLMAAAASRWSGWCLCRSSPASSAETDDAAWTPSSKDHRVAQNAAHQGNHRPTHRHV
jgi:hypothetical protein